MGAGGNTGAALRRTLAKRGALVLAALVVAGLVVLALRSLDLRKVGHALITATPEWIVLALVLMGVSLLMRSLSWDRVLHAALPETHIRWPPVMRATMIGVMASAVFPGRIGEPTRVLVLSRRLEGPTRLQLPVVAGTVVSQTLINILALLMLLAVTFTGVPLFNGHLAGFAGALAVPLVVCLLVLVGPRLLARARLSSSARIERAANEVARLLVLARQGLAVFAQPRYGVSAVGSQLIAWGLQWLACYAVMLALGLQSHGGIVAAAAILLAVNISAILPATPSNVGVFQAACVVVLAAYGVGAGAGVAYGIILQAVEVTTALLLGVPALLGEGLTWGDIRPHVSSSADEGSE